MNCDEFQNHLDRFFDGELSDEEANTMVQHVTSCEDCTAIVEDYETLESVLQEYQVPTPPKSLKTNLMQEVRRASTSARGTSKKSGTGVRSGGGLAAAALFLVGFLLGLVLQVITLPSPHSPLSPISLDASRNRLTVMSVRPPGSLSKLVNPSPPSQSGDKP